MSQKFILSITISTLNVALEAGIGYEVARIVEEGVSKVIDEIRGMEPEIPMDSTYKLYDRNGNVVGGIRIQAE